MIAFPAVGDNMFTVEKMRESSDPSLVRILLQRGEKAGSGQAHQLKLLLFKCVRLRIPSARGHRPSKAEAIGLRHRPM